MSRTLTEEQVLKKLGISDFRHMTKAKAIQFASMVPNMDPEVAKAAMEQFPAFKDLVMSMVNSYSNSLDQVLKDNSKSAQAFYDACASIIQSLREELSLGELTAKDRDRIEDKMIKVARMMADKDRENKGFLLQLLASLAALFGMIFAILSIFFPGGGKKS